MPLYEYKCTACAHRFERIMKFSDAPVTKCPKCGKDTLDQLISAAAIQFKGTGWYETDYAHKDRNSNSHLSSSEGSDSAKLQGGTESASISKESNSGSGSGNASSAEKPSSSSSDSAASTGSNASSAPSSASSSSATSGDSGTAAKSSSTGNSK